MKTYIDWYFKSHTYTMTVNFAKDNYASAYKSLEDWIRENFDRITLWRIHGGDEEAQKIAFSVLNRMLLNDIKVTKSRLKDLKDMANNIVQSSAGV